MDRPLVTIQIPVSLHDELQALAEDEQTDLIEIIRRLVALASQRQKLKN
jgi:hypothetical protein